MSKQVCALPQIKNLVFFISNIQQLQSYMTTYQILSNNTNKEIYWKPVKQAKIPLTQW